MSIESASVAMSQQRVQEEAAVRVQAMALSSVEQQSAALEKLMESAQIITDPNLGNNLDISM
jgi:hypothetical protein